MSTPLSYAPPLPWHRRRQAQRTVIRLLVAAAITFAGVWGFRFMQQLVFLNQQRHWMSYTMSPAKIILADGAGAAPLLRQPGYRQLRPNAVVYETPAVTDFSPNSNCVFIHARRAAGHAQRLIVATISPYFGDQLKEYEIDVSLLTPAGLGLGSRPVASPPFGSPGLAFENTSGIKIFAGQPDPTDESHFTIPYELNGKSNIIDGWLMSDDSVKLQPRRVLSPS
jgi:hypothetical protein